MRFKRNRRQFITHRTHSHWHSHQKRGARRLPFDGPSSPSEGNKGARLIRPEYGIYDSTNLIMGGGGLAMMWSD